MRGPLVVVGDSLLDVDVVGESTRLAPDAPVPVISGAVERARPGGAALCAWLAACADAGRGGVVLVTPLADDEAARSLVRLLGDAVTVIGIPWGGATPVKSRVRAGDHPVARLDRGGTPGELGALPAAATEALQRAGAVLVADYGNGAARMPALRQAIASAAARVPVVWDPHPRGERPVAGAALVTPNRHEAADVAPVDGHDLRAMHQRAAWLREHWKARNVVITLGSKGALLDLGTSVPLLVPAPVAKGDECGAGDCFAVTAARALGSGALPTEAVCEAVAAAAEFVGDGGAAAVSAAFAQPSDSRPERAFGPADTTQAVSGIDQLPDARALAERVWSRGGTVIATGGCFDLLHPGHIATLESARRLGDCLVVCLNSDASVRRLKGDSRPLQPAPDRARVLRALRCVDAVVVFDEDTPSAVLRALRPNVWVKGGDYTAATLPEADVLAEWGGQVVAVPYLPERSTTRLVSSAHPGGHTAGSR